ncbi:MAG: hypothetical protein ACI9R3_004826 [Verrucomicrobiales bacterium]|jgi:hypothetical protein
MRAAPSLVSIGFKEWSTVCAAIGAGRQQIILRKGGIAEGRTGFSFKNEAFFLFPTLFHEQAKCVRESFEDSDLPVAEESIPLRYFVEVLWKGELSDWESVRELQPLHIWKEQVIRERFIYSDGDQGGKGSVQLAVLRVWQLGESWRIPYHRSYGGCRSWVDLPEIPQSVQDAGLDPVDGSGAFREIVKVLGNIGINVSG